jgi:hypothetical protein
VAVVGAGSAAGPWLRAADCCRVTTLACLAAVILGLGGAILKPGPDDGFKVERKAATAVMAYVVVAALTEQFAWVSDDHDVLVAVAWLSPLVVGGVVLPRRGNWLPGRWGWTLLFAGTAALTYSTTHINSGVGLAFAWLG